MSPMEQIQQIAHPQNSPPKPTLSTIDDVDGENGLLNMDLDEATLKLFGGEEITEAEGPVIPEKFAKIWDSIVSKGIEKTVFAELVKKHPPIKNCKFVKVPTLNEEVAIILGHEAKKDPKIASAVGWDTKLSVLQKYQTAQASCLARLMGKLLVSENPSKQEVLDLTGSLGQLILNSHYVTSMYRRSAIAPCLSTHAKEVGYSNPIDEFLLGADFGEKYKKALDLEKSSQMIKPKYVTTKKVSPLARPSTNAKYVQDRTKPSTSFSRPLNWKGPSRRRGDLGQKGRSQPDHFRKRRDWGRDRK